MLPSLRQELELVPDAHFTDGSPHYTLYDPTKNQFYRLDWLTFEVVSRWSMGDPLEIIKDIHRSTTLKIDAEAFEQVITFLAANELLIPDVGQAAKMSGVLKKMRGGVGQWLLHHYLFFRVPLVKPDAWITWLASKSDFLFSKTFLGVTIFGLIAALLGIIQSWDRFFATMLDTFSWHGLLAYGITLFLLKLMHELGHAIAAKRMGCRIPTMGIAFLVLLPVAYTDTNDVWRLANRKQRLIVASAGIVTELVIAVWAAITWLLVPEGTLSSITFLLASTTWIATLLINASPFMRFDGYFLLSDFLDIPNLHARAFAMARWHLRQKLFGVELPVPEYFEKKRQRFLIAFAWVTWIYRLVVFLGIALLVYSFFIKALGIFLFLVEIIWFVIRPFWSELKYWHENWAVFSQGKHVKRTFAIVLIVLIGCFIPYDTHLKTAAMLRPSQYEIIYAPRHSYLVQSSLKNGQFVKANQLMIAFASPESEYSRANIDAKIQWMQSALASSVFNDEQRKLLQVLTAQLVTAQAEKQLQNSLGDQLQKKATFKGNFQWLNPDLKLGEWLQDGEAIALIANHDHYQAVTYLNEEQIVLIQKGAAGTLFFEADPLVGIPLNLETISAEPVHAISEVLLASQHGGDLLLREKGGQLYSDVPLYKVTFRSEGTIPNALTQQEWRGKLSISVAGSSLASQGLQHLGAIFRAQFGF